jgi:hypothetical protein
MKQNKQANKKKSRKSGDGGDIPVRPKRTFETVSCPFPRANDLVRIHSTASTTITASATAVVVPVYNFTYGGSNAASGNFDQYRLMAIRFSITPQNNAIGLVTNSTTVLSSLYCVIDYDDSTALTTSAQAQGYNNCILLSPGESLMRTFKPHMALAAYAGAFTNYANFEPQWIDSVSTGVQHYGVKVLVTQGMAGQTLLQSWDVIVEYCWELKNNLA